MSTTTPIVHIVDDDLSFLRATSRFLRASGFVVNTFESAAELFAKRDQEATGCVVADLRMPGMNGLELQSALARTRNPLPVVFLTGNADIPTSVNAMRRGAEDFLTKTASQSELIDAIRRAVARDIRERALRLRRNEVRGRLETLTQRECEVLKHVVRGQLNKQIASDLGINERTVKHHRKAINTKLGVSSVAELTQLALEAGVLP